MNEIRLIDANALKEEFDDYIKANPNISGIFEACKFIIDNAPTVELDGYVLDGTGLELVSTDYLDEQLGKDRQRGEWNYIQAGMCVCPFCGAMPHKLYKNYCAKCGAELKGGAE